MKIGILHYTCPEAERSGVTTVIRNHAIHLKDLGNEITMIYGKGGGLEGVREIHIEELNPDHDQVAELQNQILSGNIGDETREDFVNIKDTIKAKIRDAIQGLDVVMVHNMSSMPFNFPATLAVNELVGEGLSKFVFWIHDSIVLREKWKDFLKTWPFTELHFQHPNVSPVTITEYRAKQLSQIEDDRYRMENVKVVPNGINVEEYVKLDDTTLELRERLGLKWGDYVILMPIRILPRKNIELGLRIVHELKKLVGERRVRLVITGPPDPKATIDGKKYTDYLRGMMEKLGLEEDILLINDLISFRRLYEEDEIVKWGIADSYALADLVLITSEEEGFGLPVLEAGGARKPLFVSRIAPFAELLKEGIEVHMFGLDDKPANIALRIFRYFLGDIVQHNFNNVVSKYRWVVIVKEQVLPVLEGLVQSEEPVAT
ncbi:glycosyltransferase [Candidatus Bathyarchaeota archaeon]|nr:glycosyltransferase family 4 protein [Candidatus Bathyarchaeota archaeon]NIU80784.1 glycosyltransferase [Candidatus Bathyarchaeota archaeon]NIV67409.1 glycosyltransferase [Candidatus Bathyarchaeota archaeon]NIW15953.1 glycosyltransferase [Candidatus Bathyarchaeota archaeon]NIW34055.1 glycosyltransferase [Candidatus Bathyarchaeota archaeon]